MADCYIVRRGGGGGKAKGSPVIAVASASALPSSADVGTIAIISSIAVNDVYVNVTAPATPETGDVHIVPDASGMLKYQIGNAQIGFSTVYQYSGAEWVKVSAYQQTESGWKSSSLYLYNKGDKCDAVTGGWNRYSSYSAVVNFNSDHIYMDEGDNGYHQSAIQTANKILLSGFTKLKCECVNSGGQVYNSFYLGIFSSRGSGYQQGNESWTPGTVVASKGEDTKGTLEITLDITQYAAASYYVGIKSSTVLQVNKIWLEA